MLESLYLTKSKIRGRLLGFLFSNPEKTFYLSELARQVGTSAGNIQRELKRFIHDGLIRREKKGNMVFYTLNPSHALFHDLQSLIVKTTGIEGALKRLVEKDRQIHLALLYGSFAKGEENGSSDIDLLVVSQGELKDFYSRLSELERQFNREINPTFYPPDEFRKKYQEKGSFLATILHKPLKVLKGNLDEFRKKPPARIRKKP